MDFILYASVFLLSIIILHRAGEQSIRGLESLARVMGASKFAVSFFIMALAASGPNLIVGISSALRGIPQLSLGDVLGGNIVDLSIGVAIAVLFANGRAISAGGKMIQSSALFTIIAALLPILLIHDGSLSAGDGIVLILFFFTYMIWLFSKKENYTEKFNGSNALPVSRNLKTALGNLAKILISIILLILSAQGIVWSVSLIAGAAGLPIIFIGAVLVGLANCLPEVYFSALSARRGESEMILGNLMGAVVIPSSLVLGIVAIIHPINVFDAELLNVSRIFLIASAVFFFIFAKTGRQITKREAVILFSVYVLFIAAIFWFESF